MKLAIVTAPSRTSRHWKAGEITWDEMLKWAAEPSSRKDCGNYLMGTLRPTTEHHDNKDCTALHRNNLAVVSRSALTLDIDHPGETFLADFQMVADFTYLLHTTFSSTPEEPRYRLIVPTDRDMAPDEYQTAATAFAARYGSEQFDLSCARPAQYMFRPGATKREWFEAWDASGPVQRVDDLLDDFVYDLSELPVPRPNSTKRNPFEIEGVVGAFNRAYADFQTLIDSYALPYETDGDRWHLRGAKSVAGLGVMSEGLVYSHHSHDPAFGVACTAFDLIRLHRYGDLDEGSSPQTPVNRRKSYRAMQDDASVDPRVTAEIVGVDFAPVLDDEDVDPDAPPPPPDPNSWKLGLRLRARTGEFVDCIQNWDLVTKHDPVFQQLYYNDMTLSVEVRGDLPWRPLKRGGETLTTIDRQALIFYLERAYGIRPPNYVTDALVNTKAQQQWVNPVKDYLEALPAWDGVPRVETCLPGVRPTPYTRMVARKSFVAAVARMMEPGCKWDHTLVLYGDEGLGKTYWIDKISKGFSTTLGRLNDKDTLVILHRTWIMLADEGYSLRKADVDVMKEFLTRTEDVFRMPYDREAVLHRRRCVFWSTTNDEIFLRRQEGNRRFLIVHCEDKVDFDAVTPEYVDQVWAEALHLYRSGEKLFLGDVESLLARTERERFTEEDNITGIIQEYLDRPLSEEWDTMAPESRIDWMRASQDGAVKGTRRRERICSTEIWVEMYGNPIGKRDRAGLLEVTNTLKKMPEWTLLQGRHRVPNYGPQAVFVRTDSIATDLI